MLLKDSWAWVQARVSDMDAAIQFASGDALLLLEPQASEWSADRLRVETAVVSSKIEPAKSERSQPHAPRRTILRLP